MTSETISNSSPKPSDGFWMTYEDLNAWERMIREDASARRNEVIDLVTRVVASVPGLASGLMLKHQLGQNGRCVGCSELAGPQPSLDPYAPCFNWWPCIICNIAMSAKPDREQTAESPGSAGTTP